MTLEELMKELDRIRGELKTEKDAREKAEAAAKTMVPQDKFTELAARVDALKTLSDERGKKVKELETKGLEARIDAWAEKIQREKGIYNAEAVKDLRTRALAFATDSFGEGKTGLSVFMEAIEKHVAKTVEPGTSVARGLPKDSGEAGLKAEYDSWAEKQDEETRKRCTFEWFKKNVA